MVVCVVESSRIFSKASYDGRGKKVVEDGVVVMGICEPRDDRSIVEYLLKFST